jgi:hypothetical protein
MGCVVALVSMSRCGESQSLVKFRFNQATGRASAHRQMLRTSSLSLHSRFKQFQVLFVRIQEGFDSKG